MLALFSSKPFALPVPVPTPASGDTLAIDLAPHLTNSSLQTTDRGEESVRLLDELIGCHILPESRGAPDLPGNNPDSTLTSDHLANIQDQIADALAGNLYGRSPVAHTLSGSVIFVKADECIKYALLTRPTATA